ncbi:MAG: flagellar protein FlgN [Spirochaetes bacterium]|nr:flagellar protein FlgN [Spirochaetota bacterium]
MWEKDLVDILEDEKRILLDIVEKEKQKKECLLCRDLDRLLEINAEEEKLFREIEKYEFTRNDIVKRISQKFNIEGEINLSRVVLFASNKDRLTALKDEITNIISEIRMLSFENRILIESAMNVSIAILEKVIDPNTFKDKYNKEGRKEISIDINTYSTIT